MCDASLKKQSHESYVGLPSYSLYMLDRNQLLVVYKWSIDRHFIMWHFLLVEIEQESIAVDDLTKFFGNLDYQDWPIGQFIWLIPLIPIILLYWIKKIYRYRIGNLVISRTLVGILLQYTIWVILCICGGYTKQQVLPYGAF